MSKISPNNHAVVTGGSSGIGLAAARCLAQRGISVSLVARNLDRLRTAKSLVEQVARNGSKVAIFSADVGNAEVLSAAIKRSIEFGGPPRWAIASAGIVQPGNFLDQPLEAHEQQTRTNYFGTLNFAHMMAPVMAEAGGGKLIFISSGAAFVGLYGYSSYGPSKFAVRGLAETLRVELATRNITVTVAYPPDTNTPQLVAEMPLRSKATKVISSAGGVWEPEDVAGAMIDGAEAGQFVITFGWRLVLLSRLHSMIAPAFRAYQSRVVRHFGLH